MRMLHQSSATSHTEASRGVDCSFSFIVFMCGDSHVSYMYDYVNMYCLAYEYFIGTLPKCTKYALNKLIPSPDLMTRIIMYFTMVWAANIEFVTQATKSGKNDPLVLTVIYRVNQATRIEILLNILPK